MRWPTPAGPPVQPVLISQTAEPCSSMRLSEQFAIDAGMKGHERCAEAGAEVGFGFGNAAFGAGYFGGIAAEEVVHRLGLAQFADRRQDAKGIGGQEHDVLGMAAKSSRIGIGDVGDGIAGARVLGECGIVQIYSAAGAVHDHVF